MDAAKPVLRREARDRLARIPPSQRSLEEDVVAVRVQATREWQAADVVALYRAVGNELSVVGLGNAAWRDGKRTVYPRVERGRLAWYDVRSWSQLRPGAYGIPEPLPELPRVAPEDVPLWIVPGLAFTVDGVRLGQGGGYYDRCLPERGGPAWGVCFSRQVVPTLPLEPHDVRMDAVHTGAL